ncbi:MAG: VOC family protein [Rhodospirillaceae bacterium]|nr:VOC family protein [Rhodospirillaceae bacterium]
MRVWLLLTVVLALASGRPTPGLAQTPSAEDGPIVRRTTLLVSDVPASRAFYEAIGFKLWLDWDGTQDPNDPTALPLAAPATGSRIVIMAGRDPTAGMVGLLQFRDPALPDNRRVADRLGIHDAILVIESRDLAAIAARVPALGGRVLRAPAPYVSDGPLGRKHGADMLLADPDGYVVEVTETFRIDPPATPGP